MAYDEDLANRIRELTAGRGADSVIDAVGMEAHGSPAGKMAQQLTTLLPSFSVLENVALAVQARNGSSFRFLRPAASEQALNDQAMACLADVGLADRSRRLAGSLSHGEKRQLELAVALATQPRLLLLDEPLAGTGHEEAAHLVDMFGRLKNRVTMVLIEHDMDAVFALADMVSVLVYGQIVASGPPSDVRADVKVRAAYLGEEAA